MKMKSVTMRQEEFYREEIEESEVDYREEIEESEVDYREELMCDI
jgi:hypothetical protein